MASSEHDARGTRLPLAPGLEALRSGRILTGALYLLLLPLSVLAEAPGEKQLRTDIYILF